MCNGCKYLEDLEIKENFKKCTNPDCPNSKALAVAYGIEKKCPYYTATDIPDGKSVKD